MLGKSKLSTLTTLPVFKYAEAKGFIARRSGLKAYLPECFN